MIPYRRTGAVIDCLGICASAVWSVSSTPGGFMLLFGIWCGMLSAGKIIFQRCQ